MSLNIINKGNLLIAEPSSDYGQPFSRSIVLLTEYNAEGTVGFIINKPLDYSINDLIPTIVAEFTVFYGGPVNPDEIYFIHNKPEIIPDGIEIANGIYWGGHFENAVSEINNGTIMKDNIRFFLGYSGWELDQLEDEINSKYWIVVENQYKNEILGKVTTDFWKEKIQELGGDYLLWVNTPENPFWN
jgi:putative transcriptional regulator